MIRTWLALSRTLAIAAVLGAGTVLAQEAPAAPATPVSTAPAPVPSLGPAAPRAKVNLLFQEAFDRLAGKADAVRALKDLGRFSDAALRAGELVKDWQALTEQWRQQALATIDKLAAGQAKSADAERSIGLYALGEAETQRMYQLLGEALQAAGKAAEEDTVALERLRVLREKSKSPALVEALRPAVRETENRILALAGARAAQGSHDEAIGLLSKLHESTTSETRRTAILERLLAVYSDLVTARRYRLASRVALWYVANGDLRAHTWREETLRLVKLALDPLPDCGGGGPAAGGKAGSGNGRDVDIIEILCRFFVNPGNADANIYVLLGRAYALHGDEPRMLEESIRWFRNALQERHHDPEIHVHIARAHAALGQTEQSMRSAVTAINLGWPVRWILDDPELEAIRETECYLGLKSGSLF